MVCVWVHMRGGVGGDSDSCQSPGSDSVTFPCIQTKKTRKRKEFFSPPPLPYYVNTSFSSPDHLQIPPHIYFSLIIEKKRICFFFF